MIFAVCRFLHWNDLSGRSCAGKDKVEAMLANAQKPGDRIITDQDLQTLFGVI